MKERQAGGGAKSGRYMKHDTARLRCLQRVVYPQLRMGILPTAVNAKMLFDMSGPRDIAGPAKKEMDIWSNVYGWDPRQEDVVVGALPPRGEHGRYAAVPRTSVKGLFSEPRRGDDSCGRASQARPQELFSTARGS